MDSTPPPQQVFSTVEPMDIGAEEQRPIRFSAFIALLLGVISSVALLSRPLIIFPVLTVIIALFALRPSRQGPPVGRWAAVIGAFLAALFGSWGWMQAEVRQRALVQQATRFGHDWLVTLAQGDKEMALELSNHDMLRQPESMPLRAYYATEPRAKESMQAFLEQEEVREVIDGGPDLRWKTVGQPRVTQRQGADHVTIYWQETSRGSGKYFLTELVREWDPEQEVGQWRLERFLEATEPP